MPPRWLASHGIVEALREQGFRVLADENGIRFLRLPAAEGLRSRVLTFRAAWERDPAVGEVWRCRVLVAEVARTTRRGGGLVRINVRAKDLRRPPRRDAVLAAVDTALTEGAAPETYRMHARPARVA